MRVLLLLTGDVSYSMVLSGQCMGRHSLRLEARTLGAGVDVTGRRNH